MRIVEETTDAYDIECSCGMHFIALKGWGVATCTHCGRNRDPRRLRYKWARSNSTETPNNCQAL